MCSICQNHLFELMFTNKDCTQCRQIISNITNVIKKNYILDHSHNGILYPVVCYENGEKTYKEQINELCKETVQYTPTSLQYVINQTDDICIAAVQKDGCALKYVKNQTDAICKEAVKKDGMALHYVKNKTKEIINLAIMQNNLACVFSI